MAWSRLLPPMSVPSTTVPLGMSDWFSISPVP